MADLVIKFADLASEPIGTGRDVTAEVLVTYTREVPLTDGTVLQPVPMRKQLGPGGTAIFSVTPSDSTSVIEDFRGFGLRVEWLMTHRGERARHAEKRRARTVKVLTADGATVQFGRLLPAEDVGPQYATVGELLGDVTAVYATVDNLTATATALPPGATPTVTVTGPIPNKVINIGVPRGADGAPGMGYEEGQQLLAQNQTTLDAAQAAQTSAASSASDAADAVTLAQQAQAAAYNVPDTAMRDIINNPATETGALIRNREPHALVTDYGAVGDGVTDDTAAIQAAIDGAQSVQFTAGTYRITAPLVVTESHTTITLPTDATILVDTGYAGDVWRIGGVTSTATRGVTIKGGQIKEDGKSGGAITPPGSWTAFHVLADSAGTTGCEIADVQAWWPGVGVRFEVVGTGWANGNNIHDVAVWYPGVLLETDRNGGTQVAFAGNTVANVVGQCGDYTTHGIASLHGRGWNLVNVSAWDIAKNPAAVSLEVMADARSVNIIGGLLTTQNVTVAAPPGEVLTQDQSTLSPWAQVPTVKAAAEMQPDTTVANVPTMTRRGQAIVWSLQDGAPAVGVAFSVLAPMRATSAVVTFWVAGVGGATGAAQMTAAFTPVAAGTNLTGGVTTRQATITLGADDVVVSGTVSSLVVTPGSLYSVRLYRAGTNAADTYAGNVALCGVSVQFT